MVLWTLHPASPLLFIVAQLAFMFYWLYFTLWLRQKQKGSRTTYTLWAMNNSENLEKAMQQSFFSVGHIIAWHSNHWYSTQQHFCSQWSTTAADPDQVFYPYPHNESELDDSSISHHGILENEYWSDTDAPPVGLKVARHYRYHWGKLAKHLTCNLILYLNC